MERLNPEDILSRVRAALAEDIGPGDATTLSTVPEHTVLHVRMAAREPMVICGLDLAACAFRELSSDIQITRFTRDGDRCEKGTSLMDIRGSARAILTAERTALNFVQRLSGVSTLASQYVEAVKGTRVKILDTRKTTPGWRRLEKYAVACGGATNHRTGLFDQILIKDNHLAALREARPNAIAAAVKRARSQFPALKVEVEADTLRQVQQALDAGADIILLDNMTRPQLRKAVSLVAGRARTEASGGVSLRTVRGIAQTGVDFISVGALTHSAPAVDIGLDFV